MKNASCVTHWSANGILTVRVEGPVDVESLIRYAHKHKDVWVEHACILWDFRLLDPSVLTSESIKNLPETFSAIHGLRAGGRTALLVRKSLELIAKIIVVQNEANDAPVEHRSFCSEADAISWLGAI